MDLQDTTQAKYYSDGALLATTWNIPANAVLDPWYFKEFNFYPPIQVRLGAKIGF